MPRSGGGHGRQHTTPTLPLWAGSAQRVALRTQARGNPNPRSSQMTARFRESKPALISDDRALPRRHQPLSLPTGLPSPRLARHRATSRVPSPARQLRWLD